MTVRACVVDDATPVRESLIAIMPRLLDVGRFATVEELLASGIEADVVVLDLHLVNSSQPQVRQGLAAVRAVAHAGHRVCVYSQEERRFVLAACLAAGAAGVVSKWVPLADAEEAFCEVAADGVVVPTELMGLLETLVRRRSITVLGPRQRDVLAGRARGLSYAQLSRRLHVGESTLRGYWRDVSHQLSAYLQQTTAADLESALGLAPGDLLEAWPSEADVPEDGWWRL